MKVGGNESATKFFQTHGGGAALASKDPKTKYTSQAAVKYKEELGRRVEADAKRFPDAVVVEGEGEAGEEGSSTPAGEPAGDDFFSSWDKPAVKRPSNPPIRTGTPANGSARPASPFLNANTTNGNGIARSKSPLNPTAAGETAPPAASRTISSSTIRKSALTTSKPKANILGAKKTKLGAKKVDASVLDFDEAEKKAREEAERKARLGYDPDEVTPSEAAIDAKQPATTAQIHAPTPVSPPRGGGKASEAEVERLGMGVRRLGFGQVGGAAGAAPVAKKAGFGAVGKPVVGMYSFLPRHFKQLTDMLVTDDTDRYAREKFSNQKGISSDEFFGRADFDPNAKAESKQRLQGFEGATSISSNAYFGRPEDQGDGEDYGDLESAAKDFVRKFGITAGDDLENLSGLIGEGAGKLQGAITRYLNG